LVEQSAVNAINLQRYPFAPLLVLAQKVRKYYHTDPSRNVMYQSMVDMIDNDQETPNTAMLGILDIFMFASTKNNQLWCVDITYNTRIFEEHTCNLMNLHFRWLCYQAARRPQEPLQRAFHYTEEAQPDHAGIELKTLVLQQGILPFVVTVKSGWGGAYRPSSYYDIRSSHRLKRNSALELWSASGIEVKLKPKERIRHPAPKKRVQPETRPEEAATPAKVQAAAAKEVAAAAKEVAAAAKEVAIGLLCPAGHTLRAFTTPNSKYWCDLCGTAQAKGATVYHCARCQYDKCLICAGFGPDEAVADQALAAPVAQEETRLAVVPAEEPKQPVDPVEERRLEVQRCLARAQRSQAIQDRTTTVARGNEVMSFDAMDVAQRTRPGAGRRPGRRGR
jgi:hypothetical protein